MKKVCRFLLLVCLLSSCISYYPEMHEVPNTKNSYELTEAVSRSSNNLIIKIDPLYEAFCVLSYLCGEDHILVNNNRTPKYEYFLNVDQYFKNKLDPSFILRAKSIISRLYLDTLPGLCTVMNDKTDVSDRYYQNETLSTYDDRHMLFVIEIIQKFCHDTDFNTFYNQNREFYSSLINRFHDHISSKNITDEIEDYLGESNGTYIIVLEPFHFYGNFGIGRYDRVHEKNDSIVYLSPKNWNNNVPDFYSESALITIRHEFGHSFANKMVDDNWQVFSKQQQALQNIDGHKMQQQGYGFAPSWRTMVYEHIVRAIANRLTTLDDPDLGQQDLEEQISDKGFIYIESLIEKLKTYEQSRDQYPMFQDYIELLAPCFE